MPTFIILDSYTGFCYGGQFRGRDLWVSDPKRIEHYWTDVEARTVADSLGMLGLRVRRVEGVMVAL